MMCVNNIGLELSDGIIDRLLPSLDIGGDLSLTQFIESGITAGVCTWRCPHAQGEGVLASKNAGLAKLSYFSKGKK